MALWYPEKRVTNVGHERGTKSPPAAVRLLGTYPLAREIFGPEINSGHISRAKARESSYLNPTFGTILGTLA